jgi:hypothetical protein
LNWPARFPDGNPMENLWAILARQVYANNKQNTSVLELKEAISKAYDEIGQDVLQSFKACQSNFSGDSSSWRANGLLTKWFLLLFLISCFQAQIADLFSLWWMHCKIFFRLS